MIRELLVICAGILAGASAREGDLAADEPNDIAANASAEDHPAPAPDARQVKTASGPLRVHPTNPRYFTDNSGRALYFAGSDTYGLNHKFDEWPTFTGSWSYFVEFLDWMESHNQNFLRCWGGFSYLVSDRHPWQRTGPGSARDGDPKFDMSRFNQSYFDMLKGRLAEIQRRGLGNLHGQAVVSGYGPHSLAYTEERGCEVHSEVGLEDVRARASSVDVGDVPARRRNASGPDPGRNQPRL